MFIGRHYTIESAHFIPDHEKCGKVHGHSYKIEVQVSGPVGTKKGMVMDFHDLDAIVDDRLAHWDHQELNKFITVPTAENIAYELSVYIIEQLELYYKTVTLRRVRVYETERSYAEWRNNACR